jgi:aspartate kinase
MNRPLEILKFGGSSVATPERMRSLASLVAGRIRSGTRVAVVVSAMGSTTDDLIDLARDVSETGRGRLDGREMDQLLATGEQQSVALFALALKAEGIEARSFTAQQAGFRAKGFPMEGRLVGVDAQAVREALNCGITPVVTGFQGVTDSGDVITLGRGGSDLSAVALAAALDAEACRVMKDVVGIRSADPKVVPAARRIPRLSYEECMELSVRGAKVLQARSVEFAARYGVRLYVGSSFEENKEGTWVEERIGEGLVVKAVVSDTKAAKVAILGVPDVPGVAAGVFRTLAERGVGVEMIVQNGMRGGINDITFLVRKDQVDDAIDVCRDKARELSAQGVSFDAEIARVSVVGAGIANHPEVPARMFEALAGAEVNLDMIASSSLAITCVVAATAAEEAVRALHREFVEKGGDA